MIKEKPAEFISRKGDRCRFYLHPWWRLDRWVLWLIGWPMGHSEVVWDGRRHVPIVILERGPQKDSP